MTSAGVWCDACAGSSPSILSGKSHRRFKCGGDCVDNPNMKMLLSVGIYFGLVLVLAFVLAKVAPRESLENDPGDDEL